MDPRITDPRTLVVFAGPSLAASPLLGPLADVLRPPVRAGDLTEATRQLEAGAHVLIVDGEFGQSQAITLTEIRTAVDAGFHLWGAASMGALRAAECAPLGMAALGTIAGAYLSGDLVADDEVALAYDPDTYEPFTVPLVNVRRLTGVLTAWGATTQEEAARVLTAARAVHFRQRTFAALRRIVENSLTGGAAIVARHLLEPGARPLWDAKLADAEAAVTHVLRARAEGRTPQDAQQTRRGGPPRAVPADVTALHTPETLLAPDRVAL
ncbi:TfuA-like protein [Actinomycetota bacterium Odt1-20B]